MGIDFAFARSLTRAPVKTLNLISKGRTGRIVADYYLKGIILDP